MPELPCCGTKCAGCCTFISLWAVIMLALLGVFFYVQSPSLSQNLAFYQEDFAAANYSYSYIEGLYMQNAVNCWITALIYLGFLVFSSTMLYFNLK